MFGQSNTPFGGGGFGQQPATNTQPGSLFGSPQPAFGGGGFGSPAPAPSGFGGTFGAPAAPTNAFGAPTTTTPTAFGTPAPVGGFGSTTGAFGAPAPTNTFGSPPATGFGAFGAPAAPTNTFGAPTNTFGSTNTTGGGLFGQPTTTTGGGLFGQAPAPTTFGAPAPSAFGGGGGLFGSTTTSTFGAAPTSQFGSQPPAPAFGAAPVGGLFQSTPAPAPSLFGSSPAPAAFGAPASGGLFGSTAAAPAGGGSGTLVAPYQATSRVDGTATINLQSISAMDQYKDQSHEELRFADYSQGNRGTAAAAQPTFGGFGAAPAPIGSTSTGFGGSSLFGNTPAPAGGLFGSAPAPSGGLFGSTTPAPAPFGAPAPATGGLFGSAPAPSAFGGSSLFGSTPAPSGGLFGSTPAPSGGLFGSTTPAPAPFGAPAPATGGLFGSAPAPSAFGGSSLFGSAPAPSGGLFGSTPAPSGGLFGSSTPAPAPFGAPAPATSGLFGSAPAPSAFGASSLFAPAPFGAPTAFGSQQPPMQQQQQFQQQVQPLQVQTMFNAPIVAPGVSEVLEQQMRALSNQLDENKKLEVWRGPRSSTSPATTPTSNHLPTPFFPRNSQYEGLSYTTPRSTTEIRPRGFAQSEPGKSTSIVPSSRRDNSALMSPEAFARSSQLSLVVRPDSLRRSNKLRLQRPIQEAVVTPSVPEPIDPIPTEATPETSLETETNNTARSNGKSGQKDSGQPKWSQLVEAPAKSSGYDYYQQVIRDSENISNEPKTPLPDATPNGYHWYVPKLTKDGYEVSPSIEELSCMSEADLASVRNFSVSRPGYGKVEWEGSVDVRGANLDDIVVIETKDVSVYNLDEEKGTKPDEGTKLNRPALLTFEKVFPKDGPNAKDEVKNRFIMKLKAAAKSMNAEFVSHNGNTGIWKIRVRHFSRYALVDDDSDSDPSDMEPKTENTTTGTNNPSILLTGKRKSLSSTTSRVKFGDETDDDYFGRSMSMTGKKNLQESNLRRQAEDAARSIHATLQEKYSPPSNAANSEPLVDDDEEEYELEDEDVSQSPRTIEKELGTTTDEFLIAAKGRSCCSEMFGIHTSKDKIGVHPNRRSFRVGWLPNGSFIRVHQSVSKTTSDIVISRPVLSDAKNIDLSVNLLQSQLSSATEISRGDNGCPLYALSRNVASVTSSIPSTDLSKQAFLLLSRLFPFNHIDSLSTSPDDQVPIESRNVAAVRQLLLNLCTMNDSSGNFQPNHDTAAANIFEAFTTGNIEKACNLANSAGCARLALLLASSSTRQENIVHLLKEIKQTRGLNGNMSTTVLRLLHNLGGDLNFENETFAGQDKTLDWCRRLASRISQRPNDTLRELMEGYEDSLVANEVPYPYPSYLVGSASRDIQSLFYRLLRICADPTVMSLCEAIDPDGYTPHHLDYYLPFHLASMMTLISSQMFRLSNYDAEFIKDGYIAQLINQGHWEVAVFVALCCIGNSGVSESSDMDRWGRYHHSIRYAKSLILRLYDENDPFGEQRRNYLESTIGIPSVWFDEAMCYRSATVYFDFDCMDHLFQFDIDLFREAMIQYQCPEFLLLQPTFFSNDPIELLSDLALPNSLSMALQRYANFTKQLLLYRNEMAMKSFDDNSESDVINESDMSQPNCQILRADLEFLYDYFVPLNDRSNHSGTTINQTEIHALSFVPISILPFPDRMIPMTSLVSEIVQNILQWKKELII